VGGWIIRAHLADCLFAEPDLLLLDEPTNHLDLQSVDGCKIIFENTPALSSWSPMIVLPHAIVRKIIRVYRGKLLHYQGDYEAYLGSAPHGESNSWLLSKSTARNSELQTFIDRFAREEHKSGSSAKQTQTDRAEWRKSRRRSRRRLRSFSFPQPARSGARVLELKHVEHAYGE